MKRDMKQWVADTIAAPTKQAVPVLSFPAVQLMGITVRDLISSSDDQSRGMKLVADKVASGASVSLMDLSVEAECFGSEIRVTDDEVPTVVGAVVEDEDGADALVIPEVGACRTGIYIEAIAKASEMITDRPVLAGVIGPFSLAGRLMDVGEAMAYCYEEPDMVHTVLEKTTTFLINYCNAYKAAGANGVVMAEPLAGMLSPNLAEEFSHPYVKRIVEAVQSDEFAVIYHNCGDNVALMTAGIYDIGAMGYHFGNACRMADMLPAAPADVLVMGNVDPAGQISHGTPASVREATLQVMNECCHAGNFVISTGCDIPPMSPWENIEAFFAAVNEYYN